MPTSSAVATSPMHRPPTVLGAMTTLAPSESTSLLDAASASRRPRMVSAWAVVGACHLAGAAGVAAASVAAASAGASGVAAALPCSPEPETTGSASSPSAALTTPCETSPSRCAATASDVPVTTSAARLTAGTESDVATNTESSSPTERLIATTPSITSCICANCKFWVRFPGAQIGPRPRPPCHAPIAPSWPSTSLVPRSTTTRNPSPGHYWARNSVRHAPYR